MVNYSAIYIYKGTSDKGQELRHSIRSLSNVKNWNGEVYVCGDSENWFKGIKVIDNFIPSKDPHQDAFNKRHAIAVSYAPDDFIYMNDDIYITEETIVEPLHQGSLLSEVSPNNWQKIKNRTKTFLNTCGIKDPKDYDIHVPMILNKQKMAEVISIQQGIEHTLAFRSLYGNLYKIGGIHYEDRKTHSDQLLDGRFISTRSFTRELEKLFPEPSNFERI